MKELYLAIKKILEAIPDFNDETQPMFKTIKIDKGQFDRIINNVENDELPILFPAIFIHFTNVSYLTSQARIDEGRGTMRVRFVLDRVNDQDEEFETEIFDVAQVINAAIMDAKDAVDEAGNGILKEKIAREYFDMPQSSNQLQPCWVDYSVNFTDSTADKYRKWIERKIITPKFTNFSDIEGDTRPDVSGEVYDNQITIVKEIE